MASSNRHWPSLFKSKPCCAPSAHHQWPHDIISPCQKPNSYASGAEERAPEPKPRWNPKPEQIRILEAIFNSGMVNPPRDEIRRIRAQLQEYGQVGDANVFYWFQNRKSRSKHKQRHLKSAAAAAGVRSSPSANPPPSGAASAGAPPPAATSSSSSDRSSSGSEKQILPLSATTSGGLAAMFDLSASPTPSVNQSLFHTPPSIPELSLEASIYLPAFPPSFSCELPAGVSASALWGDLLMQGLHGKNGVRGSLGFSFTDPSPPPPASANLTTAAIASELQAAERSTVFINEVAYEVMPAPLNVRQAFGDEAILFHSSGHPVLTDEWGLTLQPLQHGASYYLVQ